MLIGIDASRAFLKRRTGIEEYAYQTIKHLRGVVSETDTVFLYVRKKLAIRRIAGIPEIDFKLPKNWKVKGIWAPRFWTQLALSWEMFWNRPDVLFVPAHTVPFIHPKKTIVTIHGLEYEFCKKGYSFWARFYMKFFVCFSCRAAETVICVSENTKRDVMKLYNIPSEKIRVVYEGYVQETKTQNPKIKIPYLLFVGRLETRKNIVRIIEAFEILKKKYNIPHQLILAGKSGYEYERIRCKIQNSKCNSEIQEIGYVTEEKKWELLKNADVFLFPTLYEGFGIPVLEAQSVGVPVVASQTSSLSEVGGEGAIYVDPMSAENIAEGVQKTLADREMRNGIIKAGLENVGRFSWEKCAKEIATLWNN